MLFGHRIIGTHDFSVRVPNNSYLLSGHRATDDQRKDSDVESSVRDAGNARARQRKVCFRPGRPPTAAAVRRILAPVSRFSGSDRTADTAKISTEAQTDFIGVEEAWDPSGAGSPLLRQLREEVRRIGQRLDDEIASRQGAELKCQRQGHTFDGFSAARRSRLRDVVRASS